MTRIQKALCSLLCFCLLGTLALAFPGSFSMGRWRQLRPGDLWELLPLWKQVKAMPVETAVREDRWTCGQLALQAEVSMERLVWEENRDLEVEKEEAQAILLEPFPDAPEGEGAREAAVIPKPAPNPVLDLSPERLADSDYLMEHFFIRDPNTSLAGVNINAAEYLGMDMTLKQDADLPQILIYHSHSQEDFADSVPGDPGTMIVGVGDYLTSLLQDTYGYQVIHLTETFDVIDGQLDRSRAYDFAKVRVEEVLAEHPSIEVVIDLHRDGVDENRRLVTEINGKPTAQLMCFNGLSNTVNNGPIGYLPNPHIQENLAFSFQLEMQAAKYYPELYRGIYLAGYRYNLHLRPKSILLEAGAQTNTVQEVKNAMEPFAQTLHQILSGEE